MKEQQLKIATQQAELFIQNKEYSSLPIDILKIAEDLKIVIQAKPTSSKGVSGMLVKGGDTFGIMYATHISSPGFQRFSIAHEIGHYMLPGHPELLFPTGDGIHESRAGFSSDTVYEREADYFAVGLLMPSTLFKREMVKLDDGLTAIMELSNICETSLESTALRYVEKAATPVAMIRSERDQIDYCCMSNDLQDFNGFTWIHKGSPLPNDSETFRFNSDPDNIKECHKAISATNLQTWFGGGRFVEAIEEVIGLGSYGKTLTIITTETFADDLEEEENQEESWTPRFRR